MKTVKSLSVILAVMFLLFSASGCLGFNYIAATGTIEEVEYDFSDFNEIEISNAFEFEITQSDNYSIAISAYESIIPYLNIYKTGNALKIKLRSGYFTNHEPLVRITMPQLVSLEVSGASRGTAEGFSSGNNMNIEVSGASSLETDFSAADTRIEVSGASKLNGTLIIENLVMMISGASRCELQGDTDYCSAEVSGASHLDALKLEMEDVDITVSGASTAVVYAENELSINVSGASKVEYAGNPDIKHMDISGASKVEKINND
jgi:hypothetical protein